MCVLSHWSSFSFILLDSTFCLISSHILTLIDTITMTAANVVEEQTLSAVSSEDERLMEQADEKASNERFLCAARLLRQVSDPSVLHKRHHRYIEMAQDCEQVLSDLHEEQQHHDCGWKKQSESHGQWDTVIYYKVERNGKLYCRLETPIETGLLNPLLAVFNESNLYSSWMPSWKHPVKLGVRESKKLYESGRGNQVIQVTIDMPFPFADRQIIQVRR
jgi:hypothetical protein